MGPLTSFQSLPFINIYSSSSTKNNILEPREKKKINAKHRELGLQIMCQSGMEPRAGERLCEHRARVLLPLRSWARPLAPGSAAQNPLAAAVAAAAAGKTVLGCSAELTAPPSRLGGSAAMGGHGAGGSLTQCERKEGGYF